MPPIRTRPMTDSEFEALRSRMIRQYAAEHVAAGDWARDGADARAAAETDDLLPLGVATPGISMLVAETQQGAYVGWVWVAHKRSAQEGGGAWIYDIEVASQLRGQGFGRALLSAAEAEAARHGATAMGLNVFGTNSVARALYESAGYVVATIQLKKPLEAPGP